MPRRFKVLISAYACEPHKGSEPEVGWQWALQMARHHEVTVLTRARNREAIEAGLSPLPPAFRPNFIYHELDPLLLRLKNRFRLVRPYYVLWQRTARGVIARELQRQKFDLLHHITFAAFRYPAAIWGHGVPSIWGPIGGIESTPVSLLPWGYPRSFCVEVLRNLDNLLQVATMGVLRMRARNSSLVLVSTREMGETFSQLGVTTELMPAIGLNTSEFPVSERRVHSGPLRLLYVGNLLPLKGLDFALKALKASGTQARLTLIGSGPFQKNLQSLTARLGLREQVEFRGRVPREQVLAAYKDFDVFLFPSLHDTGGYAVIEAMGNALPVICLATGGPETAVQNGCGIRVPLASRGQVISGLANAIQAYDHDRERILWDGQNARRSVAANYDWARKCERMNEYYERVLTSSNNQHHL